MGGDFVVEECLEGRRLERKEKRENGFGYPYRRSLVLIIRILCLS